VTHVLGVVVVVVVVGSGVSFVGDNVNLSDICVLSFISEWEKALAFAKR
jgi:hypothetical protein